MRVLRKLLIILATVATLFAVAVAWQPEEFRYTRAATISASAAELFPQVNELRNWEVWSPWAKLDPNAKYLFEGPSAGVGAVMRWDGNNDVGQGSMTITESRANEFVQFRLDFVRPMKTINFAEFNFRPASEQTSVTWVRYGRSTFLSKAISLIMRMEKRVGGELELGLANLKSTVEAQHP
jgi:hypothetical protein